MEVVQEALRHGVVLIEIVVLEVRHVAGESFIELASIKYRVVLIHIFKADVGLAESRNTVLFGDVFLRLVVVEENWGLKL
jgi:uncharacterized transporter YbjL